MVEIAVLLFSLKDSAHTSHWIALVLALSLLFLQSIVVYWLPKMLMASRYVSYMFFGRFKNQCCRVLLVYNTKLPTITTGSGEFFTNNLGINYNKLLHIYSKEQARRIALRKTFDHENFVK